MNSELFYRFFDVQRSAVNEDGRTVDVSFSSETPVKRWFGHEYLLHGKGNVDLARLKSMGAALLNHDPSQIVGAVQNPRIEDNRGLATVVFDDDDDGNRAFGKVKSGSLKGLSVGYQVSKFRDVMEGEEFDPGDGRKIKGPAMVALRWQPYEISFTPIPADPSVGVGRAATRSLDGIEVTGARQQTEDNIEAFLELVGRAQAVSPEVRDVVVEMAADGASKNEISAFLHGNQPAPDAGDNARDHDGTNHGNTSMIERMDDEAFDRMVLGTR